MPQRFATIDVGTNTALLLVAEVDADGSIRPLHDEEEITRLGRGLDRTGKLSPDRIAFVAQTLERFASRAHALGAHRVLACATSAARDATNRAQLLASVKERCGLELEVLSGEEEAELCFRAVHHTYGRDHTSGPVISIDIGGGSTEIVLGEGGHIAQRRSYQVGSVRLTERFATRQPIPQDDWAAARAQLRETFADLRSAPPGALLVGVAATVTNLAALHLQCAPHKTEGIVLRRADIARIARSVADMPPAAREQLVGLDARRADVLPMGGHILEIAMDILCASECVVTDRGLRYGLLLRAAGR